MDEFVNIGFTKKPHGTRGELKIQIEDEYLEDFLHSEVVFLEITGKTIPFFVEKMRAGNPLIVKFEDTDTREDAQFLAGKTVFLRQQDLSAPEPTDEDDEVALEDLVGFRIVDLTYGDIGEIEEIAELPEQLMAILTYHEREVLIPLVDDLIEEIHLSKKTVTMDLPEGLLEL
jgi:16S rRNA processing protein RimM